MPESKVLIINSQRNSCVLDSEQLPKNHKHVTVLFAHTIAEAQELFRQHDESIAVITVNVMPDQGVKGTCAFVQNIRRRRNFCGKILAAAGGDKHDRALLDAGCSWRADNRSLESAVTHALSTSR